MFRVKNYLSTYLIYHGCNKKKNRRLAKQTKGEKLSIKTRPVSKYTISTLFFFFTNINIFHLFYLQANDQSLFARFYYADKNLTYVANELDSFDGRAEPERCSRLVGKLRQGQVRIYEIFSMYNILF